LVLALLLLAMVGVHEGDPHASIIAFQLGHFLQPLIGGWEVLVQPRLGLSGEEYF